jgi:group I intron endonuclease
MIIYKVSNLVNGKVYIGKTSRGMEQRKKEHLNESSKNKNNIVFHKAIRKYGINSFKWEIIDSATNEEELNKKEQYWISIYNSYIQDKQSNGYNMSLGGEGQLGFKQSKEHIRKSSDTRKRNGSARGSNSGSTNFSEYDVMQIKELLKNNVSITEISKKYNVSHSCISNIKTGKTWTHVGEDISYINFNGNAKLSENEIKQIKQLLKENNLTQKEIANLFNVDHSTVNKISIGKIWKNIGGEISLNKNKRLTEKEVIEIKLLLRGRELNIIEIAELFNTSHSNISQIKSGKTWKHIGI